MKLKAFVRVLITEDVFCSVLLLASMGDYMAVPLAIATDILAGL